MSKTIIDSYYILKSGKIVTQIAMFLIIFVVLECLPDVISFFLEAKLNVLFILLSVLKFIIVVMIIVDLFALGKTLKKSIQVVIDNKK